MAIAKLDFNRGQVVNPLSDFGDDLLKYGASLHQQEKDRLAAEKQNELLNMQKAEHQMKVDAEKRELEELANTKAFNVGLAKPREMAEAYAIYNQINNPLLQKQINDIAFTDAENAAYSNALTLAGGKDAKEEAILEQLKTSADPVWQNAYNKSVQQSALGKFGSTMASDPAYQETRLQQGIRLLGAMGDKAPLSAIKQVEEMRAAEIASETAKAKDAREAASKSQDDLVKFLIEVAKLEGRNGTTITADDGTVLSLGGKSKVVSPLSFTTKQAEDQLKSYEEGMKTLTSRMDALGAGKAPDIKTAQRVMAMDALNKYAAEKYDPVLLANIITTKFQNDPRFYEVWKDKQTGITLTPEELKTLDMKREADAQVNSLKAQEATLSNILAQAKSAGGSGKNILEAYAPYYQGKIAKADAESKLLAMPLEKRQMQATANAMRSILTPKEDTETASTQSSAKTINPTNIVPKQKESFDATVDRVVDYHKATSAAGYALATMALLESGFEPNVKGDKGSAQGIYQHRLDRLDALKKFGNTDDVSKISAEVQTDFAVKELRERPATPQFVEEYRKANPDAGFVSQWDELNSKKTAGEAAAYLSEHFEVAKGASKNPNIKEAMKEEAARRGKIADEIFGADHDEFKQNKRKINKIEANWIKESPAAGEDTALKRPIDGNKVREGLPVFSSTSNGKSVFDRTNYSTETVNVPMHRPTGDTAKDLATIYKADDNQGILDKAAGFIAPSNSQAITLTSRGTARAASVLANDGYETPEQIEAFINQSKDPAAINAARNVQMYKMRQDPKYADILRNKDISEIKWAVGEGLLGAIPVGKLVQKVGGKILPGLVDNGLAVAPKLVDDVTETLKRAQDFNKIGIWRELRSRGVEVTDAMVEEILRKGKVLPAR